MTAGGGKPRVVLIQGGSPLRTIELDAEGEWTLGRVPTSAIVVAHPSVGREHARIVADASGTRIEDLKSRNGTYVNDARIEGIAVLRSGDILRLGQTQEQDPLLVRFEDPTSALLDALSGESSAEADGTVIAPSVESAGEAGAEAGTESPPAADGEGAEPAAEPPPPEHPSFVRVLLQPGVWITVALVIFGGLGIGLWLVKTEAPASRQWQSVRVEPARIGANGNVVLRAPQIEPSERLRATIDGREATIESLVPGEIRIKVPDLGIREMGVRSVALVVEDRGLPLFQQPLEYEVAPEIRATEPAEVAVGGTVEISGAGFPAEVATISATIGGLAAPIVSATPEKIVARIPILTRDAAIEAPLIVTLGSWISPPLPLKVRAKDSRCFPMPFEARHLGGDTWEIRHPLGPALVLDGPPPAGEGETPKAVADAVAALGGAFERAKRDPTLRFEARDGKDGFLVYAIGAGSAAGTELTRTSLASLEMAKASARHTAPASVAPYWNVVVLNAVLDLFAKAIAPADGGGWRAVLKRLRETNLEAGGRGCPGMDDVAALTSGDRELLRQAAWAIPDGFGNASGLWAGNLEGLRPGETEPIKHVLRLTLRQNGTDLEGSGRFEEVRSEESKWSPPPVNGVRGKILLGSDMKIDVTLPANQPFRVRRVAGKIDGEVLEGTYTTENGSTGKCTLRRVGAP